MSADPIAAPAGTGSPTPADAPDLDEIAAKWLRLCGACDAGLSMSCTCPSGDPRNVISNLVDEVKRLRAQLAEAQTEQGELAHAAVMRVGEWESERRQVARLLGANEDCTWLELKRWADHVTSVIVGDLLKERDAARAELSQVQKERDAARKAIDRFAEFGYATGQLQALREGLIARSWVPVGGDEVPSALRMIDDYVALAQEQGKGLASTKVRLAAYQGAHHRLTAERDEARSALAALRAEVGKIADRRERERPDDIIVDALRALVTDQSPRECSTCNSARVVKCLAHQSGDGCEELTLRCPDCVTDQSPAAPAACRCPTNEAGDIRCHNCGERVNKRCWKCRTPRGDGPCPTAGLSPTSDTQTDTGGEP